MRNLIISLILIFYSSISLSQFNYGLATSIGFMFNDVKLRVITPSYKVGLTIEKNITTILKISSNITYNRQNYSEFGNFIPEHERTKTINELFEIPLNMGVMLNTKNQSKNKFYLFAGYSFYCQFKSTTEEIYLEEKDNSYFIENKVLYYHNVNIGLDYIRQIKKDYFCSIGIIWQNGIPSPKRFYFNDIFLNVKFCRSISSNDKNVIEK